MKEKSRFIKAASILAVSFFSAILLVKPVGVSTQFSVIGGIVQNVFDKDLITEDDTSDSGYESTNAYYNKDDGKIAKEIKNPVNYSMLFVLAIPFGAFLGYLSDRKKQSRGRCAEETKVPGKTKWSAYVIALVGGFLLLFGARMAGGCTSGHMMSGMMQGSVSGYVFAAAAFLTAIPTAIIMRRKGKDK